MRSLPVAALVASLLSLSLASASAGATQRTAPADSAAPGKVPHVVLMQLTLKLTEITDPAEQARRVTEFQAAMKALRQCDDAEGVAKDLGVDFIGARDVPLSTVPPALQQELSDLAIGTATHMFGQRGTQARVLLLCGRSDE